LDEGWAASVERRKEVERIQDRLPSRGALEGDDPHEAWQETADAPILRHELLVIVVIGRPSEGCYRIHGVCEVFPRHVGEHRVAHLSIRIGVIEEDGAGLPEAERGLIEIPNRAQPLRLSKFFGFGQNIRNHQVEQVEGIVQGRGFHGAGEGE
jgi:hypothetical protein